MKMTEFRSQQPLNDDDFKTIRRNVMTTIAARRERRIFPIVMRFALAAAAIVAVVIALIPHRQTAPTTIAVTATHPPVVISAAPAPVAVAPVAIAQASRPVTHRVRHHRTPHVELARQNIRVEFRTSDPDIRIIWIANQTPNTTSGGKS
jgi:lysylphosphatidylglycerol synthetase-like protein (DUF2156 family)